MRRRALHTGAACYNLPTAMRFIDEARVFVHAGKGGDGAIAFLREKYRPFGGPAGGDGGRGGSVILEVDEGLSTLLDFKYQPRLIARDGESGRGKQQYGKAGADLIVRVPPGTVAFDDESGETIADLVMPGSRATIAQGGDGGRGNMHFVSSTRRSPRIATPGTPGDQRWVRLELRLVAEVGTRRAAERGKIDAAHGAQRGASENRRLSFHHAHAESRARVYFRRRELHDRRYSRPDRRRASRARPRHPLSAPSGAHADAGVRARCYLNIRRRRFETVRAEIGAFDPALLERPARDRAQQDRSSERQGSAQSRARACAQARPADLRDLGGEKHRTQAAHRARSPARSRPSNPFRPHVPARLQDSKSCHG